MESDPLSCAIEDPCPNFSWIGLPGGALKPALKLSKDSVFKDPETNPPVNVDSLTTDTIPAWTTPDISKAAAAITFRYMVIL